MLLISLLLSSIFAADVESMAYVICKNRSIVRTIQVDWLPDEGNCVTLYTKGGVSKEVGRAQNRDNCVDVIANIKRNLIKAGWKCSDVSEKVHVISAD